jgi:hypothetical protein
LKEKMGLEREREREKERSEDVVGFEEGAESNGKRKKGRF